jgi:cell division septum initiation protein DivIVA
MVEVTAKYDTLQVELTHVKEENAKLNAELTALTDAAEESGGADVVVVRKNELLMKDLEAWARQPVFKIQDKRQVF